MSAHDSEKQAGSLPRYLAAVTLSSLGDWFSYVAISALAASGPMRAISIGAVVLAQTIPRAALAPLAGWLCDRVDRRALLAGAELFRGVSVVGMAWAALRHDIVLVHAFHVVRASLGAVSDTAGRAALPDWVGAENIARANRVLGIVWSATFVLGIFGGGIVAARASIASAFAIDALTFFLAAPIVLALPRSRARDKDARKRVARPSIFRALTTERGLRNAAFLRVPLGFLHGAAFVVSALHVGVGAAAATGLALVHGARAIGNVVGTRVGLQKFWRGAATPVGAIGAVASSVACMRSDSRADESSLQLIAIAGAALWGFGMGANWIAATTTLQKIAPREILGSAIAVDAFAFTLAWATGAFVVVVGMR